MIAHAVGDHPHLPRFASQLLERALATSPVVVLMGARQTGKSTLVQTEPFSADRLCLTLDDLEVQQRARLAPDELLNAGPRITVDEVSRRPLRSAAPRVVVPA